MPNLHRPAAIALEFVGMSGDDRQWWVGENRERERSWTASESLNEKWVEQLLRRSKSSMRLSIHNLMIFHPQPTQTRRPLSARTPIPDLTVL